jgi:2,3-bisphosphoglycerate-independent phosphoglycerate mutase
MKRAIIIPAGAAGASIEAFDGRSALAAAQTPHMDWISMNGRQGCVATIPEGVPPGSDIALLSLFGYDPKVETIRYGPLEAAGRGLAVRYDQLVFRCNFVTITDGVMEDFAAGHISGVESDRLIADLNEQLADERCRFFGGGSFRALMVATGLEGTGPRCTPPHDIPGMPVAPHMPRGSGAKWVEGIMMRARQILAEHDVNLVRGDLGENPATDIWLWGQGRPQRMRSFPDRFGISGVVVAGTDLACGLGKSVGLSVVRVAPDATTCEDSYFAGRDASVAAVDDSDLVIVHIETPDDAGHIGDAAAKLAAIEQIDAHIVGPVLDKLRSHDQWKILVVPDHPTPVERRVHTADASPFCMAGHRIQTVLNRPFSEANAATSDLQVDPGHELMEFFLKA